MKFYYLIAGVLLVICLLFFLAFYESIFWAIYERTAVDRLTCYLCIPFLLYFAAFFFREKYKYDLTDDNGKIWPAFKESVVSVVVLGILYWLMFAPVIAGAILASNSWMVWEEKVKVYGTVVDVDNKYYHKEVYDCSVTITTKEGEELTFEMNSPHFEKYARGSTFDECMMKGIWGLLYQNKTKD